MSSYASARHRPLRIVPFLNPSGATVFRVTGWVNGKRVRENVGTELKAIARRRELEGELWKEPDSAEALRATQLSATELAEAEAAWLRLREHGAGSLLSAADWWLKKGKAELPVTTVFFDHALEGFLAWVESTPSLRPRTKKNLRTRLTKLSVRIGHRALADIKPETVEGWLEARDVSQRSRANDRLVLSRFFSWTMERPRHWLPSNPATSVKVELGELSEPRVLSVDQCRALLKAAQTHEGGRVVPSLVLSLFAALRPEEVARIGWQQVNLKDRQLRVEAGQSKVGRPRVVELTKTAVAWLKWCETKGLTKIQVPRKPALAVRKAAGIKEWPSDVLRHTGISHLLRRLGSFADTAMQAGNSERVIRDHYLGRVSSDDAKALLAVLP